MINLVRRIALNHVFGFAIWCVAASALAADVTQLPQPLISPSIQPPVQPRSAITLSAPAVGPSFEEQVVELVNQERWTNGQLPPIKQEALLDTSSELHSGNMASRDFFAHCDPDTDTLPWDRMTAAGYIWTAASENLAAGYDLPSAAVISWMNSPGHRANILSTDYREIGVGYVLQSGDMSNVRKDANDDCVADTFNNGPFYHYWTLNFGTRSVVFPVIIDREAYETPSQQVDLYVYGTGWATQMRIRNESGAWTAWQPFAAELSWGLSGGNGAKEVFVELKNGSGSILYASDTIFLNGVDPAWLPDTTAQADSSWTYVNAATGYLDPVVLAGPPTFHGTDPGVVRLQNISELGFGLRFQEWDYRQRDFGDTNHAIEDILYVIFQPGRHTMSDGSVWEAGTFDLGGTGAWQNAPFSQPFVNPPYLFLTVQTTNGAQAVSVRARNITTVGFDAALFEEQALMDGHAVETIGYLAIESPAGGGLIDLDGFQVPYLLQTLIADSRWTPVLSQRLKLEEERSFDTETGHIDETLHLLALDNQILAQQVTHNGADPTALRRLEPTKDAPMEWGLVRGLDHSWQTLPFAKTYTAPVLVAKPASNRGSDPGVIRIQGVTGTHAQLRYEEWDYLDDQHWAPEDVFYMVSEAGEHGLGGLSIEADRRITNKLGRAGQWEPLAFNTLFNADPVVLASVMTYQGVDTVTTRIRNLDFSGFELAMDEQESKSDVHTNETLGWIAIQQGSGTTTEGRKIATIFDQLGHTLTPVPYPSATAHRYPTVVGDVDSTLGADPVFLRYANPGNAQIDLKLAEEQSADTETTHVLEDVGVFVGE